MMMMSAININIVFLLHRPLEGTLGGGGGEGSGVPLMII